MSNTEYKGSASSAEKEVCSYLLGHVLQSLFASILHGPDSLHLPLRPRKIVAVVLYEQHIASASCSLLCRQRASCALARLWIGSTLTLSSIPFAAGNTSHASSKQKHVSVTSGLIDDTQAVTARQGEGCNLTQRRPESQPRLYVDARRL